MDGGSYLVYPIIILFLILGGGFFAGTEISLASVSRIRMMNYADNGSKQAKRVLYVLDNFDQALTTLLIGNNIMHLSCASVATVFAQKMWGSSAVAAMSFVTTFLVFFFSEMIPKSFAKTCNEKFALASAGPLIVMMKVITPVAFIFTCLTKQLEKMMGVNSDEKEPTVTEDELKEIIDHIDEAGTMDEETTDLVKNVLAFSEAKAQDIATPWPDVTFMKTNMKRSQVLAIHQDCLYSRYPVLTPGGKLVGILSMRRYLKACANGQKTDSLLPFINQALIVDAAMPVDDLLPKMSAAKTSLAIVKNTDGSYVGVVSVEDALEELVGEIYDESDEHEEDDRCEDHDHREDGERPEEHGTPVKEGGAGA